MKKLAIIAMFALMAMGNTTFAEVTRNGNTFSVSSASASTRSKSESTEYKYKHTDGQEYPIYINTASGRCHIKVTSKSSGKTYNKYLAEDIEKTICKELGITWTPKQKKNETK